jgi:uncharacterized protein (TIGR03083 family)
MDLAAEYAAGHERVAALARGASANDLAAAVPACPGWTVGDLVSHLTGVAADVKAGNLPSGAQDSWTAAQVESRRGRTLDDVLAEWDGLAPAIEEMIVAGGSRMFFLTADVVSHEHDAYGALGRTGDRGAPVIAELAGLFVAGLGRRSVEAGLPPLAVNAADGSGGPWMAGKAETADASVTVPSAFESLRAMSGRRNADQVRAWEWSTDPAPWLPLLSIFTMRETPLVE